MQLTPQQPIPSSEHRVPTSSRPTRPLTTEVTPSHRASESAGWLTRSPAQDCLQSLVPLTEKLASSLTCPICLEYMSKARQLQCGHLFCADCIVRILRMRRVRCALCKQKTGKRMVRAAPLPFSDMVRGLHVLQSVLKEGANRTDSTPSVRDGFCMTVNDLVSRHRSEREARERSMSSSSKHKPGPKTSASTSTTPNEKEKVSLTSGEKKPNGVEVSCNGDEIVPIDGVLDREEYVHDSDAGRQCIMCPNDPVMLESMDVEKFGRWMRVASNDPMQTKWSHENCAFFSEDIYEVDGVVENAESVLQRKAASSCAYEPCEQKIATIHCSSVNCPRRYHFMCAVADDCELVVDGYRMFCPEHKNEAPRIDEAQFLMALSGATEPVAMQHDDACYLCQTGGRLLMCDSCTRTTHPACSGLRSIPIGEWRCGVCTGVHDAQNVHAKRVSRDSPGQSTSSEWSGRRGRDDCSEGSHGIPVRSVKRPRRTSDCGKRMVITHTGLDDEQKEAFAEFSKAKRLTVKDDVEERVTHVLIGALSLEDKPTRTMKLCKAVARKLPILCWRWVLESCKIGDGVLPIDDFIHSVTRKENEAPVFDAKIFCFSCFKSDKKRREELVELVRMGGGVVIQRDASGHRDDDDTIFVCNDEAKQKGGRKGKSRFEPPSGANVVSYTWILDQITQRRDSTTCM